MKIALMGSAPSSIAAAPVKDASHAQYAAGMPVNYPPSPYLDESWEIWGCSPGLYGQIPRCNRWFETHRWEPGAAWFSPEYCQFLRTFRGPVYTGAPIPEIQNYVVYPVADVEAEFSSYFLTSSLSLMFALAIMEIEGARDLAERDGLVHDNKDDVIGLWGVDMAATEEYGYQRAGCQFFVLEAMRRGIGVYLPPESNLLRPMPVYGIIEHSHQYIKMTAHARELNQRIAMKQQQIAELTRSMTLEQGALGNLQDCVSHWTSPYGLPHGIILRHDPGTGLGSGVNTVHGEPMPSIVPFDIPTHLAPPEHPSRAPIAPAAAPQAVRDIAECGTQERSTSELPAGAAPGPKFLPLDPD